MAVKLFDADFYRAANPDLAGLNNSQALSHFQTFGLNEGREFSPLVNLNFYRSSNSDLANFNNQQIYDHLRNHGVAEGRRFSPFVDLNFYQDANSDLANFNNEQVFKHLRDYGVTEGRRFSPFLDLNFYRASNSDLATFNNKQALQHLEIHGLNEGRDFSLPFDLNYYRERNSDLVAAGLNNSQLLQHFELHGLNEGRASSPDFNVSYYRFNNSDLVAADFNYKQAYEHYVLYGYNEGRLGVALPTQQWIQQLVSTDPEIDTSSYESHYDSSNGIAVDSAGNTYITGVTSASLAGTTAGNNDAWVAKYNNSGNRLWVQQFGTVEDDSASDLGVDSAGNIYITGVTYGSLAGTNVGNADAWVAKYDNNGNRLWMQQFGTSASDIANSIAVDTVGNAYIIGDTDGSLGGANAGNWDTWLTKYDSSGNRLWIQQFGTSNSDLSNDIAVDCAGNTYIVGETYSVYSDEETESVYYSWLAKYNRVGNHVSLQQFDSDQDEQYNTVAVDSAGNVYLAGSRARDRYPASLVTKYDSSGNRLWAQDFELNGYYNRASDIAVNSAGSIYITGSSGSVRGGSSFDWVAKLDSSGHQLWKQNFSPWTPSNWYHKFSSESISGVTTDSAGNFYLTGDNHNFNGDNQSGNDDAWVAKYS